jgi:copper(I)-binding protein
MMRAKLSLIAGALLLLGVSPALAQGVEVRQPWARASAGANGAAYMTLANPGGEPDRLLSVESPAAERVELHTHIRDGEVMRMRAIDDIPVPAGGEAKLAPGGMHVMLMGLKKPLREGDRLPLTLKFEHAGTKAVEAPVQGIGAPGPAGAHGDGHGPAHGSGHGTHR